MPTATNRATVDLLISSPLLHDGYQRLVPEFGDRGWEGTATGPSV